MTSHGSVLLKQKGKVAVKFYALNELLHDCEDEFGLFYLHRWPIVRSSAWPWMGTYKTLVECWKDAMKCFLSIFSASQKLYFLPQRHILFLFNTEFPFSVTASLLHLYDNFGIVDKCFQVLTLNPSLPAFFFFFFSLFWKLSPILFSSFP